MAFGIILIAAGILIAVYPPLLSIIVAVILIMIGAGLTATGYRFKKMQKKFDDPFFNMFFRF
jgi:Flp pilus assembly protein TadB